MGIVFRSELYNLQLVKFDTSIEGEAHFVYQ